MSDADSTRRTDDPRALLDASMTKPSEARVYDYLLGGAHNFAMDREFAEAQLANYPDLRFIARENRKFLYRAVNHLVDQGLRQFVDIGSGVPTQGNVHQVAEAAAPGEPRVVYIDIDPVAHAHTELLLEEDGDVSRHRAVHGDLCDAPELWREVLATGVIDPEQPVALLMVAVLHFISPDRNPVEAVDYYRDQMVPGSALVISHATEEELPPEWKAAADRIRANYADRATNALWARSRPELEALFGGWTIVEPGVVWTAEWNDGTHPRYEGDPTRSRVLAGVARKP